MMQGAIEDISKAVGNTPIVRLNRIAAGLPVEIYVKCEFLNPGGSHKDRLAANMLRRAEESGLKPAGTIVEATSGNTGASLALLAALRGYKCVFVMPDKMSQEKIAHLRAFGEQVLEVAGGKLVAQESVQTVAESRRQTTACRLLRGVHRVRITRKTCGVCQRARVRYPKR